MAQPTPYEKSHEFLNDEVRLPTMPGSELDVEFNNLETTIGQILANLALIQADDGRLIGDTGSAVTSAEISIIKVLTQAQYDALTPVSTTLYIITD